MLAAAPLLPIAILSWLGLKVLEQDRAAERQRRVDALEVAAQRLAVDIERWLEDAGSRLTPAEAVQLVPAGLVAPAHARMLYQPLVRPTRPVAASTLDEAEASEYQRRDFRGAARAYAALAESGDPHIRARALLALSRVTDGPWPRPPVPVTRLVS